MVTTPTVATLATALPEIMPNRLLATIATFAEPPRNRPMIAIAKSVRNCPPPVRKSTWPKAMKANTMVEMTKVGMPRMPSESR